MNSIHVVIAAGGSGQRFGSRQKKQFLMWQNKSLLQHTLDFFLSYPKVKNIVVVLPKENLATAFCSDARVKFVAGGATRAQSVQNGVLALHQPHALDCVLVHDAARPNLQRELVDRVVQACSEKGSAIPTIPVTDTLKTVAEGRVVNTVDRTQMRAAQTPQGVRFSLLHEAFQAQAANLARVTDEAMLLEESGFEVFCVEGDPQNLKVTTPMDLAWLEFLASQKED